MRRSDQRTRYIGVHLNDSAQGLAGICVLCSYSLQVCLSDLPRDFLLSCVEFRPFEHRLLVDVTIFDYFNALCDLSIRTAY